jgi:hypothetical protein
MEVHCIVTFGWMRLDGSFYETEEREVVMVETEERRSERQYYLCK